MIDAEELAKLFHATYEALAPSFNYQTRKASAVPWEEVPDANRHLMIATCRVLLKQLPRKAANAQSLEAEGRMWQHKAGLLLSLIEEHGSPELFERACAAMNVNWYTGVPTDEGWDLDALASIRVALNAARAAGLQVSPDDAQGKLDLVKEMLSGELGGPVDGRLPSVRRAMEQHTKESGHESWDDDAHSAVCRTCDFEFYAPDVIDDFFSTLLRVIGQ